MIDYRTLGAIPEQPHTVFEVGGRMAAEHVFTREGFSDLYSILYQKRAPTHETKTEPCPEAAPRFLSKSVDVTTDLRRRHVPTPRIKAGGSFLESRVTLFRNGDVSVGVAKPTLLGAVPGAKDGSSEFFVNGDADEVFFVGDGAGTCETMFGCLDFTELDYVVVPRGVPFRFRASKPLVLMTVEARRGFQIPAEFRHQGGQLKLDAPYGHRDFRSPDRLLQLAPGENPGIIVKRRDHLTRHTYTDFPYQVVGWDGFVYPFAFSVTKYRPKTSTLHLPPTSHLVFGASGFVMMNFVPRIVDYHEKAIPCPYPHSSVDCDEILFYARGEFTSRKGIEQYSITLHPGGIPHGPHPERYEKSVGVRRTDELAVMVDTYEPLLLTEEALKAQDESYHFSWNDTQFL